MAKLNPGQEVFVFDAPNSPRSVMGALFPRSVMGALFPRYIVGALEELQTFLPLLDQRTEAAETLEERVSAAAARDVSLVPDLPPEPHCADYVDDGYKEAAHVHAKSVTHSLRVVTW